MPFGVQMDPNFWAQ